MKIKTLLAAVVLVAAPAVAQAQCAWGGHATQEAAISCADGMAWDADAMSCVATTSS